MTYKNDKPIVVVSRCIGFDTCRYNGQSLPDKFVEKLKDYVYCITPCPEVEIGLGVPRDPIRICMEDGEKRLFQPSTEKDVTKEMTDYTEKFINELDQVDGFILKHRSPSCGMHNVKIYRSKKDNMQATSSAGFFGGAILDHFYGMPVEDEGRLNNTILKENFLIKLYLFFDFRKIREEQDISKLIDFHAKNKFLMMAYNQSSMRKLGKILGDHKKGKDKEVFVSYEKELGNCFSNVFKDTNMINSLQHMLGYFSEKLTHGEKMFFLNKVEEYRDERVPVSVLLGLVEGYAIRFNEKYILEQTIIKPFPKELIEMPKTGDARPLKPGKK